MSNNKETAKKRLSKKQKILIIGSAVIVCAAVIIAIVLMTKPKGDPVMNKDNFISISNDIKTKVKQGMFETHMNTTWVFPDGNSISSNAVMGNTVSNNYPFWFTLKLSDTKEIVYTSSTIPLGKQLAQIKLDKHLKKGTYPAIVTIHMIDTKGAEIGNNTGFNITIVVNN